MKEIIIDLIKKILPFLFRKTKEKTKEMLKDNSGVKFYADPSTSTTDIGEKSALIFIHGFGGNKDDTWGDTIKFIRENNQFALWDIFSYGYNSGLLPNILKGFWIGNASLDILGQAVQGEIEMLINKGYNSVSICAHSMGGLITQRAVLDITDEDLVKINSIILFGTPSNGLKKADWGRFINDQVKDLGAKSKFIARLRKEWSETFKDLPPFKFLAVAGDKDEFVPRSTSIEIFPEDQQKVIGGDHLSMIKAKQKNDQMVTTIEDKILKDENYRYPWEPAIMAMNQANFQEAKRIYEVTSFNNLLRRDKVRYILCLEAVGEKDTANQYAQQIGQSGSDPAGVLGGRYKRLFLDTRNRSHFEKAMEWYAKSYEKAISLHEKYYPGINIALLHRIYGNEIEAVEWAKKSLEQATESKKNNHWEYATQGEAELQLQNLEAAIEHYGNALNRVKNLREKESMLLNALTVMEEMPYTEVQKKSLLKVFEIELFS